MPTRNIPQVLNATDWPLLAHQKELLIAAAHRDPALDGLLAWIDAIQDAAEYEGYPVVFLTAK